MNFVDRNTKLNYDPGLKDTAVCKSAISFIDGENGRLEYRGYPIEQLVEDCSFLEVAYLLIFGELPTREQLNDWNIKVMTHTFVNNQLANLIGSFNYDAHPMGMFIATMAALSTFHKEANPALEGADLYYKPENEAVINKQVTLINLH
jgi:citrate synthase